MTHVRQCGTPSCATSAPERTGYIVVMHFSLNILRHHPCDQYMTHNGKFVVPLAARPAHKSVPATLFFILAIHTWHLWDNVVPLAARQAPKSVPDTWLLCTYPGILTNLYLPWIQRWHMWDNVVPPAARQTPKSIPATAALSCALPRPEAQPCHGAYRLHCAALSCAQRRPEAQPCHGTSSCATSAQEHTGYIALPSAAHNGAQKHSHVMVPLAARHAPKSVPVTSWTPTFTQWYP